MLRSVYLLRCTRCVNTYRKCIKTLCNEAFQTRTLKYFRSTAQLQKPLPHASEITDEYYESLLPRAQKTLESIYSDFKQVQSIKNDLQRNIILDDIDSKCFAIVHALKPYQIFDLLFVFHQVSPQRFSTSLFYEKAISKLVESVQMLKDKDVIQLLFFMSFNRELGVCYVNDIRPYLTDITKLSLFEKFVIAECFVKFDVKFTQYELEEYERIIQDKFEMIKKDSNMLMILCKALTLSSTKQSLKLEKLTNLIVCTSEQWDFKILANLLSLYARALLFEPRVIDSLVKDGMKAIQSDLKTSSSSTPKLEIYDMNKFLQSISNLGLTLTTDQKILLCETVEKRYAEYKQIKNLGLFVTTLLSLHILMCFNKNILRNSFRDRVFQPIHQKKYLKNQEARLRLLLIQANLEMKLPIPKSLDKPLVAKFFPSSNITELAEICQTLIDKKIVNSVVIECPIEGLYVPGVTLSTKDAQYHIDILDYMTCLKNTKIPHGYMSLKLRLLPRMHIRHILIEEHLLRKPPDILNSIINKINYGQVSTFHHMW